MGDPHDQGLVFRWGSLIGISLPSSGADDTSPFVAGDVEFRPNEFTGTITNDWATVPYCATDFAPYDNTATDHLVTIHNPATGVGDICRYMGVVDGSQWRMPTAAEWDELYREQKPEGEARRIDNNSDWSPGLFAPLHGYAFGPRQNNVAIISNTQVDNADPNTCGAVFLPASGHRNWDNGLIYYIGAYGLYWSSTTNNIVGGYYMQFIPSRVLPQNTFNDSRNLAMSIRCIRE